MGKIELLGVLYNSIVFIVFSTPIIIYFFRKSTFESKDNVINAISISTIIGILLYMFLYLFPEKVFSIFPGPQGARNFAYYASRILFICAPFFSIKYLVSKYFYLTVSKKNTTIFAISKIVVLIILMFLGNHLFSTKGILFAFPISDVLYIIPITFLFFKLNFPKK